METISRSVALFIAAGLCEIGGGWLVWQWLREGKGGAWGLCGAIVLILYGISLPFSLPILGASTQPMGEFLLSSPCSGAGGWTATFQIVSTSWARR